MKNWPKIQYNQVQFGINASLEINEKACDCSLFTGRRYVPPPLLSALRNLWTAPNQNNKKSSVHLDMKKR